MTLATLPAAATLELEVRKSRFIAIAGPVESQDAALHFVHDHSDPHASHSCWAWRVGATYRSSDAGEPAGTAGRPILAAIDAQGFDRVAVVVVRHFGGIKLGAGGLARAYGGTAAECLRRAPRVPIVAWAELEVRAPFGDSGAVHQCLAAAGAARLDESFDESGLRLRVRVPEAGLAALRDALRDATRGRAQVTMAPT